MEDQDQLEALQRRAAIAEATARILAAEQASALCRRTTAEHLLAAQEMEDTFSRRSRSRSRSPLQPPSPTVGRPSSPTPVVPSGVSDMARVVQYFQEHAARTQQAADEREARTEARYEAQLAAFKAASSLPSGGHTCSFTPNKGFNDITPFSRARGQDLLPLLQQLRSRANILKTSEADLARELCLKLTGVALQAYSQHFDPDTNPTFDEVAAQLAKSFIKPYQGAIHWGALFRFKRTAGSSGKEVQQQLHNASQACLNDGIPIDALCWAEHLYYIYQLSLSHAQSAQFLASLSSNPLASDDYLRTLTPTGEADRRMSQAGPQGSVARTALFRLRVTLVEAFLDHDNGDGNHGGGARAAVTTGAQDLLAGQAAHTATAGPGVDAAGAAPPTPVAEISEAECRLRLARAERLRSSKPAPEYTDNAAAYTAEFEKRKLLGVCFACHNNRVKYDEFHLNCSQHGSRATTKQRTDPNLRVPGSIPSKYF